MIYFPVLILRTHLDFNYHVAYKENLHWGYHKIPDFVHETGRAGGGAARNLKFSFSSPSGLNLLKVWKTFLTSWLQIS